MGGLAFGKQDAIPTESKKKKRVNYNAKKRRIHKESQEKLV
jgi:hypothetical protein